MVGIGAVVAGDDGGKRPAAAVPVDGALSGPFGVNGPAGRPRTPRQPSRPGLRRWGAALAPRPSIAAIVLAAALAASPLLLTYQGDVWKDVLFADAAWLTPVAATSDTPSAAATSSHRLLLPVIRSLLLLRTSATARAGRRAVFTTHVRRKRTRVC